MCTENVMDLFRLTSAEAHHLSTALALLIDEKTRGLAELAALDPTSPGKDLATEAITEQLKNIQRLATRLDNAKAVFILPVADPED